MSKRAKSQWDFGELFPPEQLRRVLTVSELTVQIRRVLEKEVGEIWVSGEITNLRVQSSGHSYFTLKDEGAQLSCVLFRGEYQVDRSLLQDGRKVILRGEVTVYEPRGQYQLRVMAVELQGLGALQAAFEKLKQKLKAEGFFATERKRPLPRYPQRIGLVTSPTGAAIRDVLHVIQRRHSALEIVLAPCRVQGEGAALEIAAAIRLLNEFDRRERRRAGLETGGRERQAPSAAPAPQCLDLILVTRGGGSLEDLWAFNEESVARAIYESRLPVVSAVGHEIDFTISDFVADIRAATPSAAAEIITEGVFASGQFLADCARRLPQLLLQQVGDKRRQLEQTAQRLARMHPRRRFDEWLQRLDDLQGSLHRSVQSGVRQHMLALRNLAQRLLRVRPALLISQRREMLDTTTRRLRDQVSRQLRQLEQRLGSVGARLKLLGPEQVLARGYSITKDDQTGSVIREAAAVRPGQRLQTRLHKGRVVSRVEPIG